MAGQTLGAVCRCLSFLCGEGAKPDQVAQPKETPGAVRKGRARLVESDIVLQQIPQLCTHLGVHKNIVTFFRSRIAFPGCARYEQIF